MQNVVCWMFHSCICIMKAFNDQSWQNESFHKDHSKVLYMRALFESSRVPLRRWDSTHHCQFGIPTKGFLQKKCQLGISIGNMPCFIVCWDFRKYINQVPATTKAIRVSAVTPSSSCNYAWGKEAKSIQAFENTCVEHTFLQTWFSMPAFFDITIGRV